MKEIFLVKESLELSLLKKYKIEKRKEKIPKRPKYEILKNSFMHPQVQFMETQINFQLMKNQN